VRKPREVRMPTALPPASASDRCMPPRERAGGLRHREPGEASIRLANAPHRSAMRILVIGIVALLLVGCGGAASNRAETRATATPETVHATATTATVPVATSQRGETHTPSPAASATVTRPAVTTTPAAAPMSSEEPTSTADAARRDVTDADLAMALLRLEDLPVGWTTQPLTEMDEDDDSTICDVREPDTRIEPAARAKTEFQQSDMGPFLAHRVADHERWETAESEMRFVRDAFSCSEWNTMIDGREVTYRITPLSFPQLGDDAYAVRVAFAFDFVLIETNFVFIRVNRYVIAIAHFGIGGVDSAQTELFARLAVERLRVLP
jgi:hypothetical protein